LPITKIKTSDDNNTLHLKPPGLASIRGRSDHPHDHFDHLVATEWQQPVQTNQKN